MINNQKMPRSELPEWLNLQCKAKDMGHLHLRDLANDQERHRALTVKVGPFFLDISKQKLDVDALKKLISLAEAVELPNAIKSLIGGDIVNNTEGRPALHSALRLPVDAKLIINGEDVVPEVHQSLARIRQIVERVHSRQWRGFSGRSITDVVNIGVGGSDLGPFMACQALNEFVPTEASQLKIHFVSSIDGTQVSDLLGTLKPETTLFIVSSKSFTTIDTLSNAHTAMQWMLKSVGDKSLILAHHFIGVSTQPQKMAAWGIPENNQVLFWEWVGGRFSLWSGIGLPIALKIGMANFEAMLAGAHFIDNEFSQKPLAENLPVLLGLIGVWNATFLDIRAHSVLPYDGRLKFFPSYLSQLEMESNGKSVDKQGNRLNYSTCPVLWGEVGPNAQHAFYQLLHQGTQPVSCDFIAPIKRYTGTIYSKEAEKSLQVQHQLALANCLAQSRVLMLGDASTDSDENTPNFKRYQGNQPSTTLLLDELSPFTLGGLVALYEHKVFVMSVIWDINPFDQWGVELGKKIADKMTNALANGEGIAGFDASTCGLLDLVRQAERSVS
ncbi:MAG TPA: glucose-6-phosphate isomerase [Agitococcus sp.]|nr:glucose-6-phosphate isomerase [Agitococcus sp.]HMV60049.1 glucose-6-phosphate isomerase [Agitococcus sp.]HMX99188.1 glucose-6-phosphate isomerase [Agitococcus sp.]HMY28014.1 glucose-6-phosphate isomerase [Agitococcus sp.]HMY81588.1 glucose-6-phosphate isomerase [Agitococcus sp.]